MAAGDIAYDWDLSSDRIAWRGRLDETVGITDPAALATGKALAGRINPEDLAARQYRINDHFAGAAAFDCDYRLRGEDGHFHWVQDRGRAERDGAGRAVRVVGIMRVITSRKALEFRLDRQRRLPASGLDRRGSHDPRRSRARRGQACGPRLFRRLSA